MTYVKINDVEIGSNDRIMFRGITESPQSSRRETKYAGYDGADYDNITFAPRPITINGTLFGKSFSDIESLKRTISNVCNPKKEVEVRYFNGATEYYAKAFPSFPVFAKITNYVYQFAIYMDFSKFYWLSAENIVQDIYGKTDNVFGEELTFPRPLTILSRGADIYNRGSVETPVVIEIVGTESFIDTIVVKNMTYDKQIVIQDYSISEGEIITIDTEEQTVTSSINGNIISYLSESSELFQLPVGYTRIECNREGLVAVSKYRERFSEV